MKIETQRIKLTKSQATFFNARQRYQNFEGAIRSGKTTIALFKLLALHEKYPGLCSFAGRWKEDDAKAVVKAKLREIAPLDFLGKWNADEHCYEVANGGKMYIRGLKPSEDASMYSKVAGLTLGAIYIDQPEEMPAHFFGYLQGRLSQKGVAHMMMLTPNPPDHDHWLAKEFPEDNSKDPTNRIYLRTTVYDNQQNLPPGYIEGLEAQYPPGSVQRLRLIEGKRGLSYIGSPVYQGYFARKFHVREIEPHPYLPVVESWDFGHKHPAVLWSQFGLHQWKVFGELQGTDEFLEHFAPKALMIRNELFPDARQMHVCCDPAGSYHQSHGTMVNAVEVLRDLGIHPVWKEGSNHPVARDGAIQKISQALMRHISGVPTVQIHPRCEQYIAGLEAGYVWDERSIQHSIHPNTRRPKKDGFYDHLQNCGEYAWINFGNMQITADKIEKMKKLDERRDLRRAQRDVDEYDLRKYQSSRKYQRRGIL